MQLDSEPETEPNVKAYDNDKSLSNEEFLQKLKENDLQILKECKEWQEKYNVDVSEDTDKMLEDGVSVDDDDLNEEDKAALRKELETMKSMDLNELLEKL